MPVRIALGALERPDQPRRHFVLMAGVGLDARIVYELDLDLKGKLGKLAYWHGGFRQFGRPVPRFHICVNGMERHCASFALITRVRNYGGDFEIARRVRLTDNDFEMVVFQNHQWQDYLRFFGAVMTNRLYDTTGVTVCAPPRRCWARPKTSAFMSRPTAKRSASCPRRSRPCPTRLRF